ncbi:unnamed protein product [Pylaiella littoralis]
MSRKFHDPPAHQQIVTYICVRHRAPLYKSSRWHRTNWGRGLRLFVGVLFASCPTPTGQGERGWKNLLCWAPHGETGGRSDGLKECGEDTRWKGCCLKRG